MLADEDWLRSVGGEHHRAQQPELAIADHRHVFAAAQRAALEHAERRGERLDEHRDEIRDRVGHRDEVARGQAQVVGVGTVAADDAEHGAFRAVPRVATGTACTAAAARVDLADHALAAREPARAGVIDDPDELVPDGSGEPQVAPRELEVGVADARQRHPHPDLARRLGDRELAQRGAGPVDSKRAHGRDGTRPWPGMPAAGRSRDPDRHTRSRSTTEAASASRI